MRLPVRWEGPERLTTPHKGLALDKFAAVKTDRKQSRKPSLDAVVKVTSSYDAYKLAFQRWKTLTSAMGDAVSFPGRVRDRMALGLGIESVHEIGCRLHHTYGVPVIPGSSLKGALAAALSARADQVDTARFLFGDTDSAGFATVFDAWWIPDVNASGLAVDVITVHHQDYYSGKRPPADTESPIPVHYLTVTGSFWFCLQGPAPWLTFLQDLCKDVLSNQGIGAKRSAGYGRLVFR